MHRATIHLQPQALIHLKVLRMDPPMETINPPIHHHIDLFIPIIRVIKGTHLKAPVQMSNISSALKILRAIQPINIRILNMVALAHLVWSL